MTDDLGRGREGPVLNVARKLCNTIRNVRFRVSVATGSVKRLRQYVARNLQNVVL
jgi:hypothetical protein